MLSPCHTLAENSSEHWTRSLRKVSHVTGQAIKRHLLLRATGLLKSKTSMFPTWHPLYTVRYVGTDTGSRNGSSLMAESAGIREKGVFYRRNAWQPLMSLCSPPRRIMRPCSPACRQKSPKQSSTSRRYVFANVVHRSC